MQQSEGRAAQEAVSDRCLIQHRLQLAAESYPGTAGSPGPAGRPGWGRSQDRASVSRSCSWVTPTEAQSISHKHCHEQPGISMARNSSRQLCQLPYRHLLLTPASTGKVPVCMKSWFLSPKSADCFGSMSESDQA